MTKELLDRINTLLNHTLKTLDKIPEDQIDDPVIEYQIQELYRDASNLRGYITAKRSNFNGELVINKIKL